jgi:hypothetical protein
MAPFGKIGWLGICFRGSYSKGEEIESREAKKNYVAVVLSSRANYRVMSPKAAACTQIVPRPEAAAPPEKSREGHPQLLDDPHFPDDEQCFETIMCSLREVSTDFWTASNSTPDDDGKLSQKWFQKDAKNYDEKEKKRLAKVYRDKLKEQLGSHGSRLQYTLHPKIDLTHGQSKPEVPNKIRSVPRRVSRQFLDGGLQASVSRNCSSIESARCKQIWLEYRPVKTQED